MAGLSAPKQKLSALIITYNEMGYIERCIDSVSFADEILVVDSYSTDGTYEFLKQHPKVRVIQHPFENFTAQKSFTLGQATHDWVLFLDADEVIGQKLRDEIAETINDPMAHQAYWFYRRFMFQNRPLGFSGWQTDKNHRLFKKSKVCFTQRRIVHETLVVDGTSGILQEKLVHYCYKDFMDYKGKMVTYGQMRAKEEFLNNRKFNYLKLLVKPAWKFFYNYVFRLGLLDLDKGLKVCYLNAFSVFVRYRSLYHLERAHNISIHSKTMAKKRIFLDQKSLASS